MIIRVCKKCKLTGEKSYKCELLNPNEVLRKDRVKDQVYRTRYGNIRRWDGKAYRRVDCYEKSRPVFKAKRAKGHVRFVEEVRDLK